MARKEICFEFGEMLMIYRIRARLSKTEVARRLKVSTATISNYETARTSLTYRKVLKFKKILGHDFGDVLKIIEDDGCFKGRVTSRQLS